jgi:uncharacterized protein (DUF1330 family)
LLKPEALSASTEPTLSFSEVVEGKGRSRIVVIEFKDYATALECYRSPEYAKAIEIRQGSAVADIIIAEGYHGPQPMDG